jgi:hypothetical protein
MTKNSRATPPSIDTKQPVQQIIGAAANVYVGRVPSKFEIIKCAIDAEIGRGGGMARINQEQLRKSLGITPNTWFKHMKTLKEQGYVIKIDQTQNRTAATLIHKQ